MTNLASTTRSCRGQSGRCGRPFPGGRRRDRRCARDLKRRTAVTRTDAGCLVRAVAAEERAAPAGMVSMSDHCFLRTICRPAERPLLALSL